MPNSGTMVETIVRSNKDLELFEYECTANGGGGAAFDYTSAAVVMGYLYLVKVIPGTPGLATLFGLTLLDGDGIDVMGGALSTLSLTAKAQYVPKIDTVYGVRRCDSVLNIVLSGNTQAGAKFKLKLYVKLPENLFQ
jgi:hypothetical protein